MLITAVNMRNKNNSYAHLHHFISILNTRIVLLKHILKQCSSKHY